MCLSMMPFVFDFFFSSKQQQLCDHSHYHTTTLIVDIHYFTYPHGWCSSCSSSNLWNCHVWSCNSQIWNQIMNDAMCCSQQHMTKVSPFVLLLSTHCLCDSQNWSICVHFTHWLLSFIAVELSIAVMGVLHQHIEHLLVCHQKKLS
jgi:hypothetical protein